MATTANYSHQWWHVGFWLNSAVHHTAKMVDGDDGDGHDIDDHDGDDNAMMVCCC